MSLLSVKHPDSGTFFDSPNPKNYENILPSATRSIPRKYSRSVLREIRPRPYDNHKQVLVRQVENLQCNAACTDKDDIVILENHLPNESQQTHRCGSKSPKRNRGRQVRTSKKQEPIVPVPAITGFESGYEAEAIVGAKDGEQGIFYLVKWKARSDMELVPAMTVLTYVPSLVILFYAKRLQWIVSTISAPG